MKTKILITLTATIIGVAIINAIAPALNAVIERAMWPALVLVGMMAVIIFWLSIAESVADRRANRDRIKAETRLIDARARRETAETITAPPGSQIVVVDYLRDMAKNVHLSPEIHVNGTVSQMEPSPQAVGRWFARAALYAPRAGALPGGAAPMIEAGPAALPPLLPAIAQTQRLILAGNSDSGKTTLVKWLISSRDGHLFIILDPHAPSKILGYDVIGAGRDYAAIEGALESLILLMSERYNDVARGIFGYGQHSKISVFIDEWTSINRKVKSAGEMLATLLTESRKVNIFLTFCVHSLTNDVVGVDNQIKKSAMQIELTGGNGHPHRAFIHPNSKIAHDGSKATIQEYAPPGPFAGHPQPAAVVLSLPDAKILHAQQMERDGASVTAIAREYFGVDRPNGTQIKEVKTLLERAKIERQTHDKRTD